MSTKANDIIGQILLVLFFFVMGAVPLSIVVLGILNLGRAVTRQATVVMQAMAALVIWVFLTYALVMIFIVTIYSFKYPLSRADELKTNAIVIVGTLIYAAGGAALIYWTRRQTALSQPAPAVADAV